MRADLGPTQAWLQALGLPQHDLPAVLVAGTNGKGATSVSLAAILSHSGYRTGLFTSPHLGSVRERIRVDGRSVSDTLLFTTLKEILPQAPTPPTYFEAVTVAAIVLFRRFKVDLGVFEVGLGGRLDASNCLEPLLSVITPIALDHQAILGDSLEAIALEKAGILRRRRPAVIARDHETPHRVFKNQCQALEIPATFLATDDLVTIPRNFGQTFRLSSTPSPTYTLALRGSHQAFSAALARTAAIQLQMGNYGAVSEVRISRALSQLHWPGRLESVELNSKKTVLLDGAHNLAGAKVLSGVLETQPPHDLLLGFLRDKPASLMVDALAPQAQAIFLTTPPSPRALPPSDVFTGPRATVIPQVDDALTHALESPSPLLVVAGSLYLVGAVRSLLYHRYGLPTPAADSALF